MSLGQTELAAQVTQETGIDAKATGMAGLASAETAKRKAIEVLVADISSNRDLLGLRRLLLQRTVWLFAGTLLVSSIVLLASRR